MAYSMQIISRYSGVYAVAGKGGRRIWNNIMKRGYKAMGTYWHMYYRPRHFTESGARQYRYAPRKHSYDKSKRARVGHTIPLVFSGESEARTARRNVRATNKGVAVKMNAPTLNFRHPDSQVNMRLELTRVLESERRRLGQVFSSSVLKQIRRGNYKLVRKAAA